MLEMYRNQIDNVDNELMILLKRRFQTAKKIADYKMKNNLEIENLSREDEIIRKMSSKATVMGIHDGFVREIFDRIIEESKRIQKEYVDKKSNK